VTCPEGRLVAFLAGELPEAEERRLDEHLLTCEECWHAVQADRTARSALERLRVPAPAGLHDRARLAVSLAVRSDNAGGAAAGRRPRRRRLPVVTWAGRAGGGGGGGVVVRGGGGGGGGRQAAAVVGLCLALGAGSLAWLETRPAGDPAQVAVVVAMMTPGSSPPRALRAGEHIMVGHQPLMVRAYEVEGKETIVATSPSPFPVPPSSHQLSGASSGAWMATKGRLSMYGVNRPTGRSMFLVAAMPMADLPQVAAQLHLI
jgi:anti-sigma factor RsiW